MQYLIKDEQLEKIASKRLSFLFERIPVKGAYWRVVNLAGQCLQEENGGPVN